MVTSDINKEKVIGRRNMGRIFRANIFVCYSPVKIFQNKSAFIREKIFQKLRF